MPDVLSRPLLSLAQLMAALSAILAARFGAIPRLSTLDGLHWQCLAIDPDTHSHLGECPTARSTSAEGAAQQLLDALHALDLEGALPDPRAVVVASWARLFPEGVTLTPDAYDEAPEDTPDEGAPLDGDAPADESARPLCAGVRS